MAEDLSDLHVVLNEESIDLRQDSFSSPVKNRSPRRTTSHQALAQAQPVREPLKVNGLRRLANNLYFNQQTHVWQKNKGNLKNTPRNRATSADPRFRRERSPGCSKEASQTQSDSQVMDSPLPHEKKKSKTQSDSKFILERSPGCSKEASQTQSDSQVMDSPQPHEKKKSKTQADSKFILKENNITLQSNNEQSTPTDELTGMQTMDCKSLYQTAVTDFHVPNHAPEVEVYNATGIYLDHKEPLSPYWDDPRLIEKYSNLLKPIQIRKSKSSWTLPVTAATPTCTSVAAGTDVQPVCSKCICANIQDEIEQAYEAYEEITENVVNYDKIKMRIYKAMNSNYYLAAFFMMGSLCGLMLVALVAWVLTNDIVWSYVNQEETPRLTGMQWLTAYIGGGILHSINVLFNQILNIMVMSRNEAFN